MWGLYNQDLAALGMPPLNTSTMHPASAAAGKGRMQQRRGSFSYPCAKSNTRPCLWREIIRATKMRASAPRSTRCKYFCKDWWLVKIGSPRFRASFRGWAAAPSHPGRPSGHSSVVSAVLRLWRHVGGQTTGRGAQGMSRRLRNWVVSVLRRTRNVLFHE